MSCTDGSPYLDMSHDATVSVASGYGEDSDSVSNSTEIIQSVGSFTCFPKLPAEIRLKIWKSALPGPRIMRMSLMFEAFQYDSLGQKKRPRVSRFVASQPGPVALRVCHESRVEALKDYELAFPTKMTPAQTYINYKSDTLFLDTLSGYFPCSSRRGVVALNPNKKPILLHKEFSKIRFLVIDERWVLSSERQFTITNFQNLETLCLLLSPQPMSLLNSCSWGIEDCKGPKTPERTTQSIQRCNNWVNEMESLIKGKNSDHWQPKIGFVRLVAGSD